MPLENTWATKFLDYEVPGLLVPGLLVPGLLVGQVLDNNITPASDRHNHLIHNHTLRGTKRLHLIGREDTP